MEELQILGAKNILLKKFMLRILNVFRLPVAILLPLNAGHTALKQQQQQKH
jgi:hypothetical protein